jgi:hypothetical protein
VNHVPLGLRLAPVGIPQRARTIHTLDQCFSARRMVATTATVIRLVITQIMHSLLAIRQVRPPPFHVSLNHWSLHGVRAQLSQRTRVKTTVHRKVPRITRCMQFSFDLLPSRRQRSTHLCAKVWYAFFDLMPRRRPSITLVSFCHDSLLTHACLVFRTVIRY